MSALSLLLLLAVQTPTVQIDSPIGGWTTKRIVTVSGTATHATDLGVLNVNGVERPLPMQGGGFSATFALARGDNAIEVIASAKDGNSKAGRGKLLVHARVPKVDLQVILFWDTDQTDVDLHITEPSGEVINYTHREGTSGGRLDRDDTDGYGPEIYSLANADSGAYEIVAHYFGDRGSGQTTATVYAVAREGTAEERRWRFEVPLVRTGEKVTLARIQLPPAGESFKQQKSFLGNQTSGIATDKDSALPAAR